MIKRYLSVAGLSILLIALASVVSKNRIYEPVAEDAKDTEVTLTISEAYEAALEEGADLCFWYDDASYEPYLQDAVIAFFEEEGIVAELFYIEDVDYVGSIYDATMNQDAFPDAYLLSGEELEKAYLYGVAGSNANIAAYDGVVANNAIMAASYQDVFYGYPLSYNVCLFVYNKNFFVEQPASLQALIDYSDDNEPSENVQYILEWDAYDPFFDFPFISESVTFEKKIAEVLDVIYDEDLLDTSLVFLQESLESFSLPIETVTEESVLTDVLNGVTLCAIVDSDSLQQLSAAADYMVMEFPALNDTLTARSAALTDMILVNDFTENAELAEAFAKYLTLDYSDSLWNQTGHYSVVLSENADAEELVAYTAYENAVLAPDSQDAAGFWIDLKAMITNCFSN